MTKIPDKIMHIDDFITFFARHPTYVSMTKIPDKIMHIDDYITFFARHPAYVSKTPGKILNLKGQCHKILDLHFFH